MDGFDKLLEFERLQKAWSESAREAAAEARKAGRGAGSEGKEVKVASEKAPPSPKGLPGGLHRVEVGENTRESTKVTSPVEVEGRVKPPDTTGVSLDKDTRPVDYGHVNELMQEKYGLVKGEAAYQGIMDKPGADRGLYFVVGQKIQMEKLAMMRDLGKTGSPDNHHYQGLYKLYNEKKGGK